MTSTITDSPAVAPKKGKGRKIAIVGALFATLAVGILIGKGGGSTATAAPAPAPVRETVTKVEISEGAAQLIVRDL